eukprot:TRINITY_DN32710_c0_g1_i1.p1 TRINITY_DN32710_c0_g1~~TRINITY_DN32710_c0_g1_i1.p1  ORF type:complete len:616 (+),score=99.89 TRINITY_DN32710_c0_g1_i1:80-1849(+)
MAMTGRSTRRDIFSSGMTGPTVGPGSYRERDLELQKVRHSSAPFSSSVERHTTSAATEVQTPGPGSYLDQGSLEVRGAEAARKSSQFASRGPRLVTDVELPKKALTPGPGSYRDPSSEPWSSSMTRTVPTGGGAAGPGKKQAINWIKVATAPSIPAPSQSYGYEEGTKGELIQQRAPEQGHAGKGVDCAGPGEYEPSDRLTKPRRAVTDFGKSRTSREGRVAKDAASRPGPGAYEAAGSKAAGARGGSGGARSTCVFASATVRQFVDSRLAELPGPGAYNTPAGFQTRSDYLAAQQAPPDAAAFGSTLSATADRFGNPRAAVLVGAPGPGAYDETKSSFEKEKSRWNVQHGVFGASAVRFGERPTTEKLTPGPGYYTDGTERQSLSAKLGRKISGRYGVFGTTSQRFPVQQPKVQVGPGSYNVPDKINPAEIRRRDTRSACFVSSVDRGGIVRKAQEHTPGVGQYDTDRGFGAAMNAVRSHYTKGTNALEPRFRPTKPGERTPGPGEYESSAKDMCTKVLGGMIVTDRRGRTGRATHNGVDRSGMQRPVGDRALRFPPAKGDVPGPGQYEAGNSLVKKTFNITIGDTWD